MASTLHTPLTVFCIHPDDGDSEEDFTANLDTAEANTTLSDAEDCTVDTSKKAKAAVSYKRIRSDQALKNMDVEEPPALKSKSKGGRRARSVGQLHHEDGLIVKVRQLGGKFAIMYMLWMSNVEESFQTKLNPNYTPMDLFKPGIEWKRQGEHADLRKVFPVQFHNDFKDDFLYST
ncbi:hypothetical protein K439DRAFT_1625202, partial [Ramaria rubella]